MNATLSQKPFQRMVPIITSDGTEVTNFVSPETWQDLKFGRLDRQEPIDPRRIIQEEHHKAYGRPWILGRYHYDYLRARGIGPTDRVLDLGCGAGRLGVWLIPFLEEGHYYGIDHHLGTLAAFAGYECLLHDLFPKRPRLMVDGAFRIEGFHATFDVVLDLFTSVHVPIDAREDLFLRLANHCAPGARLFSPRKIKTEKRSFLQTAGFELVHVEEVRYDLLEELGVDKLARDTWHEYRFRGTK